MFFEWLKVYLLMAIVFRLYTDSWGAYAAAALLILASAVAALNSFRPQSQPSRVPERREYP